MDQGESEADRAITQAIRQAIVSSDALSVNCQEREDHHEITAS